MLRGRGGAKARDVNTIQTILLILLVVDALALIGLVLLQQGKGADVGAAFGSGGANTVFGSAGSATFLTKATAWLAIGFFAISFGLAYTANKQADALGMLPASAPVESEAPTQQPEAPPADDLPDV